MVQLRQPYRKVYKSANMKNLNSAMNVAQKALAIGLTTKKLLNVEVKYKDTLANDNFSTAGGIRLINGVAQGDSGQTRDGDQCKFTSFQLRSTVRANAAATVPTRYRIIHFIDKQADGTAPTPAEVLEVLTVLSPLNMDNKMRFRVLSDHSGVLQAPGTGSASYRNIDFYKKFEKGLKTRFSGTGSATADISTNPVYVLIISDVATNVPTFDQYYRLRYVDN